MAGPVLILWLAGLAQAGCEDVAKQLDWASDEILEANPAAARTALDGAESGLACGRPASAEVLATLFLLDGAVRAFEGDRAGTEESFAAAARIDGDTWLESLGPKLRETYDKAAAADTEGGEIDVSAPAGWTLLLDGVPTSFPNRVSGGLHVLQIADQDEVHYGRILSVVAGELQTVAPELPPLSERKPEPVAVAPQPERSQDSAVSLSAGIGAIAAFGDALEGTRQGDVVSEPGVKLIVPIEVGVVLRVDPLWIRPTLGLAPLIGGRFLFATEDGAGASGFALLGDLAAGGTVGTLDLGGSAGIAYPGRITLRALGGLPLGDTPLFAEARAGVNLGTGGRVEPAVGLAVSARIP